MPTHSVESICRVVSEPPVVLGKSSLFNVTRGSANLSGVFSWFPTWKFGLTGNSLTCILEEPGPHFVFEPEYSSVCGFLPSLHGNSYILQCLLPLHLIIHRHSYDMVHSFLTNTGL